MNLTVDEFIGNALTVVCFNIHNINGLSCVLKGNAELLISQDIVLIGADFLEIVIAERQVGLGFCLAVFINGNDLNETISGDNLTVLCGQLFTGVQAEGNGGHLIIHANAELLVLLHNLSERNLNLLTVIAEACRRFGNLNLLSRVNELSGMNFCIDYHAEGSFRFVNLILAEIKRLAFSHTVFAGCHGIDHFTSGIAERSVERVNILGCLDFIGRTCKTLNLINRLIHSVCFGYGRKDLTGLGNLDNTFLCVVAELYFNDLNAAVLRGIVLRNIELHGIRAENITVRSRDLNKRIALAELQFFGSNQHTRIVGVEGVNGSHFGIGESHFHLSAVRTVDLEACAGIRNGLAAFRINLDDLDKGFKVCVIDQVAISFTVLSDKQIKVGHQFTAFPAGNLVNGVNTVRHILTLSKAVFITGEIITLGFLGCIKAAGGFQIDCEYRTFFWSLDLSVTIVGVLDDCDIAFLDLFGHINGRCRITLNGIELCFSADMIGCIIQQIAFGGFDFLDAPVVAADIIGSGELAVLVGDIGVNELISLINAVGRARKGCVALCSAGFFITLGDSYVELLEDIGKALTCDLVPFNCRCLFIGNNIADRRIDFLQRIAGTDQHILKGCNALTVRNGILIYGKSADRGAVQMEFHALNNAVFGSLSNSEITAAQHVIKRNGCGLTCNYCYTVSFLRNVLVIALLGNGIGSGHEIVDLDFASTVRSNSLIYALTDNSELDTIHLTVFGSLDDLRAAVADLHIKESFNRVADRGGISDSVLMTTSDIAIGPHNDSCALLALSSCD